MQRIKNYFTKSSIFLLFCIFHLSNSYSQNFTIQKYHQSISLLDSMDCYSEHLESSKFIEYKKAIEIIPTKFYSQYLLSSSFYHFNKGNYDSSFHYAIVAKKNHIHQAYSEMFDTLPEFSTKIKVELNAIDSLTEINLKELQSTFKEMHDNDQSRERVILNNRKYKNEKERDSLNIICSNKDLKNKRILEELIKEYGWINHYNFDMSFLQWELVVIHSEQEYIMKYVKLGYKLALQNKADWNDVVDLVRWAIAPHRKKTRKGFDPFPFLKESTSNVNYNNFLAYSIKAVLSNFQPINSSKKNTISLSVDKASFKRFNEIRNKCINLGIDKDRIVIQLNNNEKGVFYQFINQ